jgi:hypothetical protein
MVKTVDAVLLSPVGSKHPQSRNLPLHAARSAFGGSGFSLRATRFAGVAGMQVEVRGSAPAPVVSAVGRGVAPRDVLVLGCTPR